MIMSAHVFNANLDKTYPATLSYMRPIPNCCVKQWAIKVLISDDLRDEAIARYYTLQEAVTLAINSIDILLWQPTLLRTVELSTAILCR